MHLTHYHWCKSPPRAENMDTKWFWIEHCNNNNNKNNKKQQYLDCSKLHGGNSGQGDVSGACGLAFPSEANSFTHHAAGLLLLWGPWAGPRCAAAEIIREQRSRQLLCSYSKSPEGGAKNNYISITGKRLSSAITHPINRCQLHGLILF